jgi:hypothetical protein
MRIEQFRPKGVPVGAHWLILIAGVLASLIAYWSWVILLRPSSLPPTLADDRPERLAKQVQVRHLFGEIDGKVGSLSLVSDVAQMVLAGIVSSGSSKRGVAVILIDGRKAVTVGVGQEIMPGVILSRVAHDNVELSQRGQIINLRLATKK